MSRRAYLGLLMAQPLDWLVASAANPTAHMRPVHIALHRIAIRRKAGRPA